MKEDTKAPGYGCICPTADPVDCVQIRYKLDRLDALTDRCECVCHEKWQRDMDEINEAFHESPAEDERESKPVHWDLIREAFAQGFTYGSAEYLADNFTGGEDSWDQATQAAFGLWESDPENNMTPKMRAALHLREGRPTDSCPKCGARYFDG